MTLLDALYSLLMVSANNLALAIANNLGSYLGKVEKKGYFSCFDLVSENRENNINCFMGRMHKIEAELNLK